MDVVYIHSNFSGGLRNTFSCESDVLTVQSHRRPLICYVCAFLLVRHYCAVMSQYVVCLSVSLRRLGTVIT